MATIVMSLEEFRAEGGAKKAIEASKDAVVLIKDGHGKTCAALSTPHFQDDKAELEEARKRIQELEEEASVFHDAFGHVQKRLGNLEKQARPVLALLELGETVGEAFITPLREAMKPLDVGNAPWYVTASEMKALGALALAYANMKGEDIQGAFIMTSGDLYLTSAGIMNLSNRLQAALGLKA